MGPKKSESQAGVGEVGFGKAGERGRTRRLLNRDGSFNIERTGVSPFCTLSLYHTLITTSWPRFFLIVASAYFLTNCFFGLIFFILGPGALTGIETAGVGDRFAGSFFFSVQTLATIGYGVMHPLGVVANAFVAIESLVGLIEFALITGLLFARFSRPTARVIFSSHAIVAPYRKGPSLQFRMVNLRKSQLIEPSVQVVLAMLEERDGKEFRSYHTLKLVLDHVLFFPAYWTITHEIDENSPLFNLSHKELERRDVEVMVLVTATEETFSQTVHARTSYKISEIMFEKRFSSMYVQGAPGSVAVDLRQLSAVEAA